MRSCLFRDGLRLVVASLLLGSASACGAFGGPADPSSLAQPPAYDPPGGQAKCKLGASQKRPLIVEWAAADRAALEVLAQRGTVVVRYSGCEMEILPRCRAPGGYQYVATTRKTERVVIQDEDELYANLPMGAVKLEGKLQRSGQLNVNMNVVGQYDSDQPPISRDALEGDCAKATHVVTGLTVGAFEFSAGGAADVGGGAAAFGTGAGAASSRRRELLSSDGNVDACEHASRGDTEPPANCGALLRIAVAELAEPAAPAGADPSPECPQGTQRVGDACVVAGGSAVVGGIGLAGTPQTSRLFVRVTCGLAFDAKLLGEREGLKVWIDGELVPAAEEKRAFNAVAPGAPGVLQYVAYDTTPGTHRVRIAADGCEAMENTFDVKPGIPRDVGGRLQPTAWYRRPPAASVGIGFGAAYQLMQVESLTVEDDDYDDVSLSPDTMRGFGLEIPFSVEFVYFSMGFGWTKGDLPIEAPACAYSPEDCLPAGTKVEGSVSGYHIPFLLAGRLPFVYGAGLLGTGFEMNILSADVGDAEENFGYVGSSLGVHVPVWAGLEVRPICNLGFMARGAHGFSLGSDVGSYNSVVASVALYSAMGCSSEDYGIQ